MGFLTFLTLSRKLGLFCTKPGTQHYLAYIILLKWLESKIVVICNKLRAKLRYYGFFNISHTFAHKVAQTWFVLHETWPKRQIGVYYCVEGL